MCVHSDTVVHDNGNKVLCIKTFCDSIANRRCRRRRMPFPDIFANAYRYISNLSLSRWRCCEHSFTCDEMTRQIFPHRSLVLKHHRVLFHLSSIGVEERLIEMHNVHTRDFLQQQTSTPPSTLTMEIIDVNSFWCRLNGCGGKIIAKLRI